MVDQVLEQVGWPVDANGRLVMKATTSSSAGNAGSLAPGYVPVDSNGNAVINIVPDTDGASFVTSISDEQTSGREIFYFSNKNYQPKKRKTTVSAFMPTVPTLVSGSAFTGTASVLSAAPGDFDAVALLMCNINSSSMVIDSACVAVTESESDKYRPIINGTTYNTLAGATDQLGFIPVTWASASTVTIAPGTAKRPTWSVSDFISLSSIPRTDAQGGLPLVLARAYFNARTITVNYNTDATSMETASTNLAPYTWYHTSVATTNAVATPSIGTFSSTPNARIHGLLFRLRGSGDLIMYTGDSIMKGLGAGGYTADIGSVTPVGSVTWQQIAKSWPAQVSNALANKQSPVGYINCGVNGSSGTEFQTRLTDLMSVVRPTIVVAPAYTPNELMNPKVISQGMARASQIAEASLSVGAIPVIVAPTPYGGNEVLRWDCINKVKAMVGDVFSIDPNTEEVYDPSNPTNSYWVSTATVDNTHASLKGYTAIADEALKTISKLVG